MKRKIFVVLLAVTLMAAQTLTVFADSSEGLGGEGDPGISFVESTDGLSMKDYDSSQLSGLPSDKQEVVKKQIEEANAADLSPIIETLGKDAQKLVNGATALTKVFDVTGPVDGGTITFNVPSLVGGRAVYALHLTKDGTWEVIKAQVKGTEVTVKFKSLSPVILVSKPTTSGGKHKSSGSSSSDSDSTVAAAATVSDEGGVATSPKTGVVSDWTLWMGAAVVLLGISATAFRRTRA